MHFTLAEQQLISIIRAAKGHELIVVTVLVRGDRYTVRLNSHGGGPGEGIGVGDSFDEAWADLTPAQRSAAA